MKKLLLYLFLFFTLIFLLFFFFGLGIAVQEDADKKIIDKQKNEISFLKSELELDKAIFERFDDQVKEIDKNYYLIKK